MGTCREGRLLSATLASLAIAGCSMRGWNYEDPEGPRFAAAMRAPPPADVGSDAEPLLAVTYNIKFARQLDRAIDALRGAGLGSPDVLLLQEMDQAGTEAIACALNLNYVYYPAAIHPKGRKQFGAALLSPWPIGEDQKIILKHPQSQDSAQKVAVAATVWTRGVPVRVVSLHVQTGLSRVAFGEQLRSFAERIDTERPTIVAGDFNNGSHALRALADEALHGLSRATRRQGPTVSVGPVGLVALDHIYVSSHFAVEEAGVVDDSGGSDHHPLWVRVQLRGGGAVPWSGFDATRTIGQGQKTAVHCPVLIEPE